MRTKKTVLVLISGLAGTGKSTLKDMLSAELGKLDGITKKEYSFAAPLKYIAKAFLGWDGEKDYRGRKLLQELGRIGREYDENIWCRHLISQLDKSNETFPFSFVLVDDWRYPNEYDFFNINPVFDVVGIRISGRESTIVSEELQSDTSETSLPEANEKDQTYPYMYNMVIDNSGSLEDLKSKVVGIISHLKEYYIV